MPSKKTQQDGYQGTSIPLKDNPGPQDWGLYIIGGESVKPGDMVQVVYKSGTKSARIVKSIHTVFPDGDTIVTTI